MKRDVRAAVSAVRGECARARGEGAGEQEVDPGAAPSETVGTAAGDVGDVTASGGSVASLVPAVESPLGAFGRVTPPPVAPGATPAFPTTELPATLLRLAGFVTLGVFHAGGYDVE